MTSSGSDNADIGGLTGRRSDWGMLTEFRGSIISDIFEEAGVEMSMPGPQEKSTICKVRLILFLESCGASPHFTASCGYSRLRARTSSAPLLCTESERVDVSCRLDGRGKASEMQSRSGGFKVDSTDMNKNG
jgi:hypothetical protein